MSQDEVAAILKLNPVICSIVFAAIVVICNQKYISISMVAGKKAAHVCGFPRTRACKFPHYSPG